MTCVAYPFRYLVQEGEEVDRVGGVGGDDLQFKLGILSLSNDGIQLPLSQQGQHLVDDLECRTCQGGKRVYHTYASLVKGTLAY